jgi:hypothetical protein
MKLPIRFICLFTALTSAFYQPLCALALADENQIAGQSPLDVPAADSLIASEPAAASVPVPGDRIDQVSKELLKKVLELLRLNTRYRIESTRIGRFKPWRQLSYSVSGNTLAEIGASHIAYARWKYWQRPGLATKAFLRKGPECLLVGNGIITTGAAFEGVVDILSDFRQAGRGFDRKTCRNRALALKAEINKLLAEREECLNQAPLTAEQAQVLKLENRVLSDLRDCAFNEFGSLAVREKRFKISRNVSNFLTLAQASCSTSGSIVNLLAGTNRRPRWAAPGALLFFLSGAFIALTPPSVGMFGCLAANLEKKKEARIMGGNPDSATAFDADRTALSSAVSAPDAQPYLQAVKQRLQIYSLQDEMMDRQAAMLKAEARLNKRELMEKFVTNSIAGGTKAALGIQLLAAGCDWSNTAPPAVPKLPVYLGGKLYKVPIRPIKTPSQMFSRRVAQAATTYLPGPLVGGLDSVQGRLRGELRKRKAEKSGNSAGQILARRLKTLDELEKQLD